MAPTRNDEADLEDSDFPGDEKSESSGSYASRHAGRRRPRPRSGDVFLVVLLFALVLLFVSLQPVRLINLIYNPVAGLILIVIVVEYLILKSMDRTRIYQLENRRLREYRRADRVLLKRTRDSLTESLQMDEKTPDDMRRRWRSRAEVLLEDIRDRL